MRQGGRLAQPITHCIADMVRQHPSRPIAPKGNIDPGQSQLCRRPIAVELPIPRTPKRERSIARENAALP